MRRFRLLPPRERDRGFGWSSDEGDYDEEEEEEDLYTNTITSTTIASTTRGHTNDTNDDDESYSLEVVGPFYNSSDFHLEEEDGDYDDGEKKAASTEDTSNPFDEYMKEQEMQLYQIIMDYILREKTNDVERNTHIKTVG